MTWVRTMDGEYLLKFEDTEVVIAEEDDGRYMAQLIWEEEAITLFAGVEISLGLELVKEAAGCELRALRDKLTILIGMLEAAAPPSSY